MNLKDITIQIKELSIELLTKSELEQGILVVGCSSSEIKGKEIGSATSLEIGEAVYKGLNESLADKEIDLAIQCCEHLNRSLVVEKEVAQREQLEIVNTVPHREAGGSLATVAYNNFNNPVVVEEISADAGMDIGDTLIGMHLEKVAVPLRLSCSSIGNAHLTAAYTRAKLIGGERAKYL